MVSRAVRRVWDFLVAVRVLTMMVLLPMPGDGGYIMFRILQLALTIAASVWAYRLAGGCHE